jgi:hypothetical protein
MLLLTTAALALAPSRLLFLSAVASAFSRPLWQPVEGLGRLTDWILDVEGKGAPPSSGADRAQAAQAGS